MTIICALHADGETWIGADRRCTDNVGLYLDTAIKITTFDDWAVASCGDARTNTILQAHAEKLLKGLTSAYEATVRIRDLLDEHGYVKGDRRGAPDYCQATILARPGTVWDICGTLSVTEIPDGIMMTAGSGREVALGADWAVQKAGLELPPEDRIRNAIEAACANLNDCGGDPMVRKLG